MRHFCFDVETANNESGSICSIGIVGVEDGVVTETFYTLVNPETWFDYFNVSIHGITEEMVSTAPKMSEAIEMILPLFIKYETLVAHYSAFDMRHLIAAINDCNRQLPNIPGIICTRSLSRKVFPGRLSYSLHQLTDLFDIEYEAHNALGDASACNALLGSCLKSAAVSMPTEACANFHIQVGKIENQRYYSCHTIQKPKKLSISPSPDKTEFNADHPFYGCEVVFTGTLNSMTRREAAQKVVNVGGTFADTMRKSTNYLVTGIDDFRRLNGKDKSEKARKAEKYIKDGSDLQLLREDEFLNML